MRQQTSDPLNIRPNACDITAYQQVAAGMFFDLMSIGLLNASTLAIDSSVMLFSWHLRLFQGVTQSALIACAGTTEDDLIVIACSSDNGSRLICAPVKSNAWLAKNSEATGQTLCNRHKPAAWSRMQSRYRGVPR